MGNKMSRSTRRNESKLRVTATDRVLGIGELLEMILYELPPVDPLLAQRVCRLWKAEISSRRKLQRALFTEAAGQPLRLMEQLPSSDLTALAECTKSCRTKNQHYRALGSTSPRLVFANPMLAPLVAAMQAPENWVCTRTLSDWRGYERPQFSDQGKITFTVAETMPKAWFYPTASWRRMYFTQPPCTLVLQTHCETASAQRAGSRTAFGMLAEGTRARETLQIGLSQQSLGIRCVVIAGGHVWRPVSRSSQLRDVLQQRDDVDLQGDKDNRYGPFFTR
ncbi:putative F-box-like domain superfamily protein [Septoria linicola]|nr:putative F-box-like domain superfamily protein [Septoria linicola]